MIKPHVNVVGSRNSHEALQNSYWWERLFKAIDAKDAAGFVEFLTPDAQFRFGNAPTIQGALKISVAVTGFFQTIQSSEHHLVKSWRTQDAAGCEGEVTYTRPDATLVMFPFANVFQLRSEKISSYRIYIDISTLYGGTA